MRGRPAPLTRGPNSSAADLPAPAPAPGAAPGGGDRRGAGEPL